MLILLVACSTPPEVPSAPSAPSVEAPKSAEAPKPVESEWANVAPAVVTEVLRGDGRTYLRVKEAQYDFWVATGATEAAVGSAVLLGRGPMMRDYPSAELGRTFEAMTFVDRLQVVSEEEARASARLPVPEGGITVGDLFARRTELAGQAVVLRGRVVKANKNIFGKNWYHLQDGTGGEGSNDLTVTTQAEAEVGNVVVARGPLTIDKDFGFGYFFAAILEDASLTVEGK